MDVNVYYNKLNKLEESATDNFLIIFNNLLEHELNKASYVEKTKLLNRIEKSQSIIEIKTLFNEITQSFLEKRYPDKKDISGKKIKSPFSGLFENFRSEGVNLFHDFLKSVVSNTSEACIPTEKSEVSVYYNYLRNNFTISPSDRSDVEKVLKDYWLYVSWKLFSSNQAFLDKNILESFVTRIKYRAFEAICYNKAIRYLKENINNYKANFLASCKQDLENPGMQDDTRVQVSTKKVSKFELSLNNIKNTETVKSSQPNYLFDDCLKVMGLESREINRIDMSSSSVREEIKGMLTCIIDCDELQENPVLTPSGYTYNKNSIENWLANGKETDPITRNYLSLFMLKDNLAVSALQVGLIEENHKKDITMLCDSEKEKKNNNENVKAKKHKMAV